jgi:cobalamin biosynthesis Mg chelatase CobN
MNRKLGWGLFLAPFVMVLCLVFAYSAQAKGSSSHSSGSRSSSGGSHSSGGGSSRPSRPSSSAPSSSGGSNNRPSNNNRPRKVVVVRPKNGPRPGTRIRPRGRYRRQIVGGRPFLRQGNRLYTQRCCVGGRPYLVYYGNVAKPHKSHTWLWVLFGVIFVGILAATLYFLVIRRRP